MKAILETYRNMFEKFLEELPEKALTLGARIVLVILFYIVGVYIIKLIRKIVKKTLKKANADIGVIQFLDSFLKAALYVLLIFLIASNFGFDAASIVALLGSAGVAIGLAIQGSLSNFAGGVLILLLKPFKVGDYIKEDAGKNEGTVYEIQMFYTKLLTPDNQTIILPNGTLANTSMTNVTAQDKRRLDIKVGISYKADIKLAKDVLTKLLMDDPDTLKKEPLSVFVDTLGENAVILGVRCWLPKDKYWDGRYRITENVKYALDKEGIEIPYTQVAVHVKTEK